jgi:hypothetical protein
MPYDPKRLNEDRTYRPPKDNKRMERIDKGIRLEASAAGSCGFCQRRYEIGEQVVSRFRNTGAGVIEEYWHAGCWERVRETPGV